MWLCCFRCSRTDCFLHRTIETNYYIWSGYQVQFCKLFGVNTVQDFHKVLAWSFQALMSGRWPIQDHKDQNFEEGTIHHQMAGKELARGWRGVLWLLRGDLDYYSKSLLLPNVGSNSPCCYCPANVGDCPWSDFSSTSAWSQEVYTKTSCPPLKSTLFKAPLGLSIMSVGVDYLHVKLLGTDQYIYGSVLWLMVYGAGLPQNKAEERMSQMWLGMKAWLQEQGTRDSFSNLTLSMFWDPSSPKKGFPKLKGKAIEVREFGPCLLEMWKTTMREADYQHRQIRLLLKTSCQIDYMIHDSSSKEYRWPREVYEQFYTLVMNYLRLQSSLAKFYGDQGIFLFDVTIKSHYLAHLALMSQYSNPKLSWTFTGEDLMHLVKILAQSCVRGNKMARVSKKMLQKYRIALQLRLDTIV